MGTQLVMHLKAKVAKRISNFCLTEIHPNFLSSGGVLFHWQTSVQIAIIIYLCLPGRY